MILRHHLSGGRRLVHLLDLAWGNRVEIRSIPLVHDFRFIRSYVVPYPDLPVYARGEEWVVLNLVGPVTPDPVLGVREETKDEVACRG